VDAASRITELTAMVTAMSNENERLKDTIGFLLDKLDENEERLLGVQDKTKHRGGRVGRGGAKGGRDEGAGHGLRAKRKALHPQDG